MRTREDADVMRLALEMAGVVRLPCHLCASCGQGCDIAEMPRGLCPDCDADEVSEMREDLLNERYVAEEWSYQQ